MIRLQKKQKPQSLDQNGTTWTTRLMKHINNGTDVPYALSIKYKEPDIKRTIKEETCEKCAYCESKVTQVYPGDVEHIIPKSVYPRLTFTWQNLTFVCFNCNNKKRDYVSKDLKLINPYKDTPSNHLRPFGPLIMQVNGDARGEFTIKKIDLNREPLRERRNEAIINLQTLVDKYFNHPVQQIRDICLDEIRELTENKNEYSATLKQYVLDSGVTI